MISKWDKRFLELAQYVAEEWSKDPSTQVGAAIVDEYNNAIFGYNGFPRGIEDSEERLNNRDTKLQLTVHAEMNAILQANRSIRGNTLYTWPLPPCTRCAVHIIQSGIKKIVAPHITSENRWCDDCWTARNIMAEAGIESVWV